MTRESFEQLAAAVLAGEATAEELARLQDLIAQDPDLAAEWRAAEKHWKNLDLLPEPSMTPAERSALRRGLLTGRSPRRRLRYLVAAAAAVAALAIAVWFPEGDATPSGLAAPTAGSRIEAVYSTRPLIQENADVRAALISLLAEDESVNVRLSVVDVLASLASDPEIAPQLIATLPEQSSVHVQLLLLDSMPIEQLHAHAHYLEAIRNASETSTLVRERIEQLLPSS